MKKRLHALEASGEAPWQEKGKLCVSRISPGRLGTRALHSIVIKKRPHALEAPDEAPQQSKVLLRRLMTP
eukprot:1156593-Pelagomonas_calceolata.AAC.3